MKGVKIYLAVATTLLLLALVAGVYVWFIVQDTQNSIEKEVLEYEIQQDTNVTEILTPSTQNTDETERIEPIVVEVADLSETQQKTLKTFGFEGQTFTVTEEMIMCAEEAVGEAQFNAIVNGDSPSPLEALKILPCVKN